MDEIGQPYVQADTPQARMPASPPASKPRTKGKLDSIECREWHGRLMGWYRDERDRQSVNRYQMAVDEDFYDSLQYTQDDAQELLARGQAPLVFNKVKPTVNWLLGTEKRTRFDYKILPREERDETAAEVKTKLFKYIADVNNLPFERSAAFKEMVSAGLGWLEEGITTDPGEEMIYAGAESWRNVLHDSLARRLDLKDGRYLYRWRWLDLDIACELFPNRANILRSASMEADEVSEKDEDIWYLGARTNGDLEDISRFSRHRSVAMSGTTTMSSRRRVKIIEAQHRVPTRCQVMRGDGSLDGKLYDAKDPTHQDAYGQRAVTLVDTTYLRMRLMMMTESDPLWWGDSPYKHNRFSLTPLWCYRRARDGMPYGVIRDVRDAQEDYNKRASKALFILSTNRVVMDKGAIDAKDIERFRAEVSRPDAVIEKNSGKELKIERENQLGEEHLMLADRDAQLIQDIAGVTDENMGRNTNARSGIAIERRQDQGSVVTANIFDNYRMGYQLQGEKLLSLMEQFYTAKKVVRIVGDNQPIEWLPVNAVDESGQPVNDITANEADFIVSEQDFRASLRQAQAETLMEMLGKLAPVMPQAAMNLLDLVVEMWDIPNKDEWVKRIREINGQTDPSKKATPEQLAMKAKAQAMAQEQAQLVMDKMQAEVNKANAQGRNIDATTMRELVTVLYESLQAAQIVATVPNVAPTADMIAQASGFKPQAGANPQIPAPSGALPAMTPQSIHGDYVGTPAGGTTDMPPQPAQPVQAAGAQNGIETVRNDGAAAP